jgi:phage FluMu gp28-like protein
LRQVTKQTTAAGNIRFTAERTPDGHADHFWALGLAVHAASQPGVVIDYQSTGTQRASSGADGFRGYGGNSRRTNTGGFR